MSKKNEPGTHPKRRKRIRIAVVVVLTVFLLIFGSCMYNAKAAGGVVFLPIIAKDADVGDDGTGGNPPPDETPEPNECGEAPEEITVLGPYLYEFGGETEVPGFVCPEVTTFVMGDLYGIPNSCYQRNFVEGENPAAVLGNAGTFNLWYIAGGTAEDRATKITNDLATDSCSWEIPPTPEPPTPTPTATAVVEVEVWQWSGNPDENPGEVEIGLDIAENQQVLVHGDLNKPMPGCQRRQYDHTQDDHLAVDMPFMGLVTIKRYTSESMAAIDARIASDLDDLEEATGQPCPEGGVDYGGMNTPTVTPTPQLITPTATDTNQPEPSSTATATVVIVTPTATNMPVPSDTPTATPTEIPVEVVSMGAWPYEMDNLALPTHNMIYFGGGDMRGNGQPSCSILDTEELLTNAVLYSGEFQLLRLSHPDRNEIADEIERLLEDWGEGDTDCPLVVPADSADITLEQVWEYTDPDYPQHWPIHMTSSQRLLVLGDIQFDGGCTHRVYHPQENWEDLWNSGTVTLFVIDGSPRAIEAKVTELVPAECQNVGTPPQGVQPEFIGTWQFEGNNPSLPAPGGANEYYHAQGDLGVDGCTWRLFGPGESLDPLKSAGTFDLNRLEGSPRAVQKAVENISTCQEYPG